NAGLEKIRAMPGQDVWTWIRRVEGFPRRFFVAASCAIVLVVGIVDYATRWEFSFSVFYLLAVGVATWFVGKGFGLTISVVSVVVSLGGDFASSPHYDFPLQPYWNASIVL